MEKVKQRIAKTIIQINLHHIPSGLHDFSGPAVVNLRLLCGGKIWLHGGPTRYEFTPNDPEQLPEVHKVAKWQIIWRRFMWGVQPCVYYQRA